MIVVNEYESINNLGFPDLTLKLGLYSYFSFVN